MNILDIVKKSLMCCSGLLALAFSFPIAIASMMTPFWGRVPFVLLQILYADLLDWLF